MNSNNFFQKNKKVLMAAVGLIVICIVMLSWRIGKRTAGKSLDTVGESQRESIVEESTENSCSIFYIILILYLIPCRFA